MAKLKVVREENQLTQVQHEHDSYITVVEEPAKKYTKRQDGSLEDKDGFKHLRKRNGRIQ